MKELIESCLIYKSIDDVYKALHHLEKWTLHLPHVKNVEILYDDGKYQEFKMKVISDNDREVNVRSVRRCNQKDNIKYFQPDPPGFLIHHSGEWCLEEKSNASCQLTASHRWTVNVEKAKSIFEANDAEVHDHIENLLREHAVFAMKTWKSVLENGVYA